MTARKSWFSGIMIEPDWAQGTKDPHEGNRFVGATQRDLAKIAKLDLGMELLRLIGQRHQGVGTGESGDQRIVTIRIHRQGGLGGDTAAQHIDRKYHREITLAGGRRIKAAGQGSKTFILYHNRPDREAVYTQLAGVSTPTWVALAHELIHAFHHLSGTTYRETVTATKSEKKHWYSKTVRTPIEVKREELWTTGLHPYAATRISENAFRRAAGLPVRTHYYFPGDAAQVPGLSSSEAPVGLGTWMCGNLRQDL